MLKPQLKASIIILALFLAGSVAVKALGSLQPSNPTVRGFTEGCDDKPQPCWFGIVPGIADLSFSEHTIIQQGYHRIEGNSDYSVGFTGDQNNDFDKVILWHSSGVVDAVSLLSPTNMKLGDAIALLGKPSGVISFLDAKNFVGLTYPDQNFSMAIVRSNASLFEKAITGFFLATPAFNSPSLLTSWHGFVPKWRYCQLEPGFRYC